MAQCRHAANRPEGRQLVTDMSSLTVLYRARRLVTQDIAISRVSSRDKKKSLVLSVCAFTHNISEVALSTPDFPRSAMLTLHMVRLQQRLQSPKYGN